MPAARPTTPEDAAPRPVHEAVAAHRLRERRRRLIVGGFALFSLVTLVLDIATGPALLHPLDVLQGLLGFREAAPGAEAGGFAQWWWGVQQWLGIAGVDATTGQIVNQLRLPMALMAIVAGAALGAGGAEIQTLLGNPMASPYTLGMAAAAGFGASLVIVFGTGGLPLNVALPLSAFAMTMLSAGILFAFASLRRFNSSSLVLVGIALLFLFQSGASLVQYLSSPEDAQKILFWLFGSLTKTNWNNLGIATLVTAVCVLILLGSAWQLTALRLGEERAAGMGVNLRALRLKTLLIVAVMTATVISFIGTIGFIGLVAPHVARMLVGEDQRFFLPASMLSGAAFLSAASVLSKSIIPGALFPIGIITSFIGVPFFFWIILSRRSSV